MTRFLKIATIAHRADRPEKLHNARKKFRGESALEPLVLPQSSIAVRTFPTDRKLPALKKLNDAAARRKLLQKALPEHSELWEAGLELLRYKPERRLVARLHAPDGSRALLKLYHAGDFERARAGAEAFSQGAVLSVPLLGLHRLHHALVWRWLDAAPCDATLGTHPALAEEIGRALATLHTQPCAGLVPVARAKEGLPLRVLGDPDALSGLERTFTAHYCALAGVSPQRVEAYTTLSLARHIAISQRLLARRHLTAALLALSEVRLGLLTRR